jgi:hypothetical protein
MAKKKWFLLGALGVLLTVLRSKLRRGDSATEQWQPPPTEDL